jgi:hypothetical protein
MMSKVTLDELSGVMCQHMTYNNEASRLNALAAVLDRLAVSAHEDAGFSRNGGVAMWLRSIAHPAEPKREADVSTDTMRRFQAEVRRLRIIADDLLRALGEDV